MHIPYITSSVIRGEPQIVTTSRKKSSFFPPSISKFKKLNLHDQFQNPKLKSISIGLANVLFVTVTYFFCVLYFYLHISRR